MAFASQEDVFSIVEQVLPPVFEKYGIYKEASKAPFVRIPYLEAMDKYGSDKPDLRIDLVLTDATEVMQGCGFAAFEGQTVKAIVVDDFTATRKQIDAICAEVEVQTARKGFWFRVDENGEFVGGISKFLQDRKEEVIKALGLKNGDFVGLAAGKKLEAQKTAGVYRKLLGAASEKHMKKDCYEFCWIVDFPMYEIGEESGELEFCHNPFSMPQGGMDALNNQDPLEILAYQYDLVCNGVELSSGAVRNHDPEIMIKAFELVGLGEADVKAKFPAMYNAFCYGAPPHAGIAPGVDRMIMLICGEESIREIIPFPMNKNAMDIMMGAPGTVEQKQLDELHLAITANRKNNHKAVAGIFMRQPLCWMDMAICREKDMAVGIYVLHLHSCEEETRQSFLREALECVDPVRRSKTERLKGTGAKAASLGAGMLLQKIAMDLTEGIENTDILFLEEDELLAVLQARMLREQTAPFSFPMNMENRANRRL